MEAQVIWSSERSHCQLMLVTSPSGSIKATVSSLPSSGASAGSSIIPASSTSVTLMLTVMLSSLPPSSMARALTE